MTAARRSAPTAVHIRLYERRRDAEALVRSVAALQRFEQALEPDLAQARNAASRYAEGMLRRCSAHQGRVYVADTDTELAGFVCVLGRVLERGDAGNTVGQAVVGELYVAESWRGLGLGRELLARAEAHAQTCGAERLRVQVLAGNGAARSLYEAFGFRERLVEFDKPLGDDSRCDDSRCDA